jgi:ABC-2 type transport system permease protein
MRPYLAVMRTRCRLLLQYRAAAAAGLATQVAWGFLRLMILEAFYRAGGPAPMTLSQVSAYVWLGQAFLAMFPWNVDADVRDQVRTGSVAYELARPIDLYSLWFARALAMRTAPTLLRCVPLLAAALLLFGMPGPASATSFAWFSASMLLALLLACALTVILTASALWTISGDGASRLLAAVALSLSGNIAPLALLPDWLGRAVVLLPFSGIVDLPFRLYSGNIAPEGAWLVLLHQSVWTVVLVALGRSMVNRGMRRLTVMGG